MAIEIKVPRLGWSMEEGTFIEWLKRDGQTVQAGEPLFAIEGDKAIQEVEAIGTGILRISAECARKWRDRQSRRDAGLSHGSGRGRALWSASARRMRPKQIAQLERIQPAESGSQPAIPKTMSPRLAHTANAAARKGPRISPRAARVAAELGIDWQTIQGTGSTGRIRERDVPHEAAAERPATASRPKASQPVHVSATAANQARFAERSPRACWKARKRRPPSR